MEDLFGVFLLGLMSGSNDIIAAAIPSWQRKLESAQSNLFCKELFVQVCCYITKMAGTFQLVLQGTFCSGVSLYYQDGRYMSFPLTL